VAPDCVLKSTGMAIVEAILAGERNPRTLARLRDPRIKATENTIAKSLVGDDRHEHLFTLRQSLLAYRHYQELIAACDAEIEQYLARFESKVDPQQHPLPNPKDRRQPRRNELRFDLRTHLYRIFGVHLTQVPGMNPLTANTLLDGDRP
jgi:transposase